MRPPIQHLLILFCLTTLWLASPANSLSNELTNSSTVLELRNNVAQKYSSPDPHLILAKHHYSNGSKVLAFYISEETRSIYGDEKFNKSFNQYGVVKLKDFKEFTSDNELTEFIKLNPSSPEAKWDSYYKSLSISKDGKIESKQAEKILVAALADLPEYIIPKSIAAKFFLKEKKNYEKALSLYIDLYFDSPHYYDWEYAEFRIKTITKENKNLWWEERIKSGLSIKEIIENEKNPRILDVAISEIRTNWNAEFIPTMLELFKNDDPNIQRKALHTILNHPEDAPDKATIEKLLSDNDLIVRAMASFLVVSCLGEKHFGMLKNNLDSGVELIQYDTMQALLAMGGASGKKFLKENPPQNAHPDLKKMWEQATKN